MGVGRGTWGRGGGGEGEEMGRWGRESRGVGGWRGAVREGGGGGGGGEWGRGNPKIFLKPHNAANLLTATFSFTSTQIGQLGNNIPPRDCLH